ncbi:Corticotropin-releasing factor receptor 1, partial [Ophiophagus hannah]
MPAQLLIPEFWISVITNILQDCTRVTTEAPERLLAKKAAGYVSTAKVILFWFNLAAASISDEHCRNLSSANNITGRQCNALVDLIGTCWPHSLAGQLVARPCPEYFSGVRYNTSNNVYRECFANGTWAARKRSKLHYHIAVVINYLGHCISLGALLAAFVLFMRLRSIRCLRNIIHWNLITAFILRNATWFVVQLTMNPEVHESNVPWCRLVTAAYNYFHVTNFFWMFGEGCYLHTAIVLTYSTDKLRKWMFICLGWCIPFPIIVAWAIGKLYYDNENFGLQPHQRPYSTGITYMLFFVNPGEDEISRIVFIYFNSLLESFQGFFVSVFYCFLNSEVRSAVRKRWHRWQDKHSIRARVARAMSIPTSPTRIFVLFAYWFGRCLSISSATERKLAYYPQLELRSYCPAEYKSPFGNMSDSIALQQVMSSKPFSEAYLDFFPNKRNKGKSAQNEFWPVMLGTG